MRAIFHALREEPGFSGFARPSAVLCGIAVILMASYVACGRAQSQASPSTDAPQPLEGASTAAHKSATHAASVKDPVVSKGGFSIHTVGGEIKEDELKPLLVGKTLYLRAGYQENNLEFDENGQLLGHSPKASYTLSAIQISKVRLSKHKLVLDGDRYALHFLGATSFEDPTTATDKVKITPKKKVVHISFDREQVEKLKVKKDKHKNEQKDPAKTGNAGSGDAEVSAAPQESASSTALDNAPPPASDSSIDRPSDDKKGTTTTSPAHASQLLVAALDNVFSLGIDARMIDAMPDFWKLYYQAAAARTGFKPSEPGVYPQDAVDQKAKLVSVLDPPSNELAQANGVAGIALYHAVVGSDGRVTEVVAGRPIGFGLDESAEQSLRKAVFQPAMKDGKPVPVELDMVVSFRIYSKRTSEPAPQVTAEKPNEPVLPGPYTVQAAEQAHANQQNQSAQPPQPTQTPQ